MNMFCCDKKCKCTFVSVIASIIIGIVTAFFAITAPTPARLLADPIIAAVAFGIAVVYLAVLLISVSLNGGEACKGCCCPVSALLTGLLGMIAASALLFAGIDIISVLGAITSGALFGFSTLAFTSTACLIKCILHCSDY